MSFLSRPGRSACHTRQRGQRTAVWGKLFGACVWPFTIIRPSRVAANMMPTAVWCMYTNQFMPLPPTSFHRFLSVHAARTEWSLFQLTPRCADLPRKNGA